MKYTIQNAIAYREELERLIGKLGGRRISTNRDWVSFDGTESMIEAVIEFLQQNDENGNSYITAGDRPDNIIYDPKDKKMTNKHRRYKVGDVNDSYNRVRSPKVSVLRLLEKYEDTFNKQYEMGRDEKRAFVESIRNYEQFGQAIYRGKEIEEAIGAIANMVETAMGVTLKETDGWFDNITATRHTKQMKEALKVLQTEAKEIMQRQQRLEAAYEDIGQLLGRYYDV